MNLLRYYFLVGGENFDAEKFASAAEKSGFSDGVTRTSSTTKRLQRSPTDRGTDVQIFSGVSGTNGAEFATWQTALEEYEIDKEAYLSKQRLGMTTESAQLWLQEETAIVKFLGSLNERLPSVTDFCAGDFFLLLKLVYGYDEREPAVTNNFHCSEALVKVLAELKAGVSTDSEPFELHFIRLQRH